MSFFVYILASQRNGTLYIGSTDDLARRVWEHKEKVQPGFTDAYGVTRLVVRGSRYARDRVSARTPDEEMEPALEGRADRKMNPGWHDLYEGLNG